MVVTARVVVGTPTSPTPKNGKRFLFEFLSFDEFKFMKSVERIRCSHGDDGLYYAMMPPAGAWRPFGPRPTFLGGRV